MTSLFARLAALLVLTIGVLIPVVGRASTAGAQGTLGVQLIENPFLCNASVRPLGTVVGLIPGEQVEFSSPQLNGVFSRRVADASGHVSMRWNCDAPQTWDVTVRGLSSGGSASFQITGRAAPPPPDAPIGAAFDAKSAMTVAQMAIWKDFSPFNTVGVYIDVNPTWDNRADKLQTNLNASWVSEVFADGWRIIPIYVGFQAPDECATARYTGLSLDPATARNQGLASAADAVSTMRALGIGAGNPIYYDMEAYRPGCAEAVLAFLDGWTEGVHAEGYLSGVYGSRASTMFDLSRSLGRPGFDAPDAVWVSTGNGQATSFGLEVPNDGQWANARMHQYRLNVTRTYGGVTREIDENIVNAPVAQPGGSTAPSAPTVPTAVDNDGDGFTEPSPDNCDRVANPDQADLDGDGDGDVCDRDIDGDGVDNVMDFAPRDATVSAAPSATTAPTAAPAAASTPAPVATATPVLDTDGDGFAEPLPDNCDGIANPDQADQDGDGDGDLCDDDIDGDGVSNVADAAPADPNVGIPLASNPPPTTSTAATPVPTATESATSTPATTPAPTAEPTPAQVVVLPTPTPTTGVPAQPEAEPTPPEPIATPTPTPAVNALADLGSDEPGSRSNPAPDADRTSELTAETVTIEVEDDSSSLPFALIALGMFSVFCATMGVRSFLDNRTPTL